MICGTRCEQEIDLCLTATIPSLLKYPGARPTKHISIEFEIRWKFKTL